VAVRAQDLQAHFEQAGGPAFLVEEAGIVAGSERRSSLSVLGSVVVHVVYLRDPSVVVPAAGAD
jgi:hypothetical protein